MCSNCGNLVDGRSNCNRRRDGGGRKDHGVVDGATVGSVLSGVGEGAIDSFPKELCMLTGLQQWHMLRERRVTLIADAQAVNA